MSAIDKSTPSPWRRHQREHDSIVGPDRLAIALVYSPARVREEEHDANLALIVKAVNEHDANLALIVKAVNEHDALVAIKDAAAEFVAKCDRGDARSKRSYAAFKTGLESLAKAQKGVA